jgi:hypothetical protein
MHGPRSCMDPASLVDMLVDPRSLWTPVACVQLVLVVGSGWKCSAACEWHRKSPAVDRLHQRAHPWYLLCCSSICCICSGICCICSTYLSKYSKYSKHPGPFQYLLYLLYLLYLRNTGANTPTSVPAMLCTTHEQSQLHQTIAQPAERRGRVENAIVSHCLLQRCSTRGL